MSGQPRSDPDDDDSTDSGVADMNFADQRYWQRPLNNWAEKRKRERAEIKAGKQPPRAVEKIAGPQEFTLANMAAAIVQSHKAGEPARVYPERQSMLWAIKLKPFFLGPKEDLPN